MACALRNRRHNRLRTSRLRLCKKSAASLMYGAWISWTCNKMKMIFTSVHVSSTYQRESWNYPQQIVQLFLSSTNWTIHFAFSKKQPGIDIHPSIHSCLKIRVWCAFTKQFSYLRLLQFHLFPFHFPLLKVWLAPCGNRLQLSYCFIQYANPKG